jgi:hypothetical protein
MKLAVKAAWCLLLALAPTCAAPPLPAVIFTGLSDVADPGQQLKFQLQLASPYPLPISGQITLTFRPDAVIARDDPAIQFSTGGRTASFTIAGDSTVAAPDFAIQTGTVAGTIELTVSLRQGDTDVTPTPAPSRTIRVNRLPPSLVASGVRLARSASAFEVQITAFSTPRQVTQATFRFAAARGATLQATELTIPVDTVFAAWYQDAASTQFGSQFRYVQPFTVQGDLTALSSVTVTLTNAQGSSQAVTVNF